MQDQPSIPYGYCKCGCGEKTTISPATVRCLGYVKGEPRNWVRNHHSRKIAPPYRGDGLCQCGCGNLTKIEQYWGRAVPKGHPQRFLRGHTGRACKPNRYTVEDRGYETPCWVWQLATNAKGYGTTNQGLAHRVEYAAAKGPIPQGLELDHLCQTRACVNPDHLEAVTHSENHRRSVERGAHIGKARNIQRDRFGRFVKEGQ